MCVCVCTSGSHEGSYYSLLNHSLSLCLISQADNNSTYHQTLNRTAFDFGRTMEQSWFPGQQRSTVALEVKTLNVVVFFEMSLCFDLQGHRSSPPQRHMPQVRLSGFTMQCFLFLIPLLLGILLKKLKSIYYFGLTLKDETPSVTQRLHSIPHRYKCK